MLGFLFGMRRRYYGIYKIWRIHDYAEHKVIKIGKSHNTNFRPSNGGTSKISIADIKRKFKEHHEKNEADFQKWQQLEKQLAGQGYIAEGSMPLEEANRIYKALRGKYSSHASKVYELSRAVLEHYKNAGLISEEAYKNMSKHRHFSYLEFDKKKASVPQEALWHHNEDTVRDVFSHVGHPGASAKVPPGSEAEKSIPHKNTNSNRESMLRIKVASATGQYVE